jgi:hypothetical protein
MHGRKRKDYRPLWYVISFFDWNHYVIMFCWLINREPKICRLLSCMTCILAHLVAGGRRQHQVVDVLHFTLLHYL